MTEIKGLGAETITPRFGGQIDIATSGIAGEPTVHLDIDDRCIDLDRHDALQLVNALLRAEDAIGFPNDAPFPPVEVRTLPSDALIFLGVNA